MRLTYLFAAAASLLGLVAALPAQEVASTLESMAAKERELTHVVNTVTIVNGPLIAIGHGPFPVVIAGVRHIVEGIQSIVNQMELDNYSGDDRDTVTKAFFKFSKDQMELLNLLIAKANILDKLPIVGEPVAAALRALEAMDDALTVALINHMDDSGSVSAQGATMGNTVGIAIEKYRSLVDL